MESTLKKLVLAATLGLALALTFSCSSSDDNGGGGGGGSGGDVLYSSSYYDDDDYDDYSSSSSVIKSISSSSVEVGCPNAVIGDNTVSCGGQTYRTVKIENQTWMAENLNYDVVGSVCYDNDPANCDKYGRLYKWETAIRWEYIGEGYKGSIKYQGICPSGWHLPDIDEWNGLMRVTYPSGSGENLKATNDWNLNDYGKSGNGTDEYGFTALPGGYGGTLSIEGRFYWLGDYGSWWSASKGRSGAWYFYIDKNNSRGVNDDPGGAGKKSVRCIKDDSYINYSSSSSGCPAGQRRVCTTSNGNGIPVTTCTCT